MQSRYIACIVLHALGDTIGFKNGDWEFNYFKEFITLDVTNELLYEFISLGGINAINLDKWRVSDDTIIHLAIARAIINSNKKFSEKTIINIKQELVNAYNQMVEDAQNGMDRMPGVTTNKYIEKFETGHDGRDLPYDKLSGGNGAAMRCNCIGLAYYGMENRDILYRISIESSKVTHNSAIGYLGGLTVALFTAFAIENIDINEWPALLIELLTSNKLNEYVSDNEDEINDYDIFTNNWQKYIDSRFEDGKLIRSKAHTNLIFRSRYHYENFTKDTGSFLIGESGFSATIMAYDSLIDCDGAWEKLIIYSALHFGDSDTVAAIASAWYGSVYGFGDVPKNNLKYLEFKDECIDIGKLIYEKFYAE